GRLFAPIHLRRRCGAAWDSLRKGMPIFTGKRARGRGRPRREERPESIPGPGAWGLLAVALAQASLSATPVATAATETQPGKPIVEYRIDAVLDPDSKRIEGQERLIWRNPSDDVVSGLRFHLYLNAFKNNRSTFMRESGGQLRGDRSGSKAEDWGAIDVLSIRTAAGEDLRPGAR